jgi:hypothetical protein
MIDRDQFIGLTEKCINGLLREAIGYRVEFQIPYFHGIVGYMVEAPMLWIRHSRFPILFIAYDRREPNVLPAVVKQLEIAHATEFFALLIVVPTRRDGMGREAQELRQIVSGSLWRHDFVVLDRQHLASIISLSSSQRLIEIILEQGVELSSLSPYVVHGPVPEKMFFGREREVKVISQGIQSVDYAVVGGRRIGKSSILLRLKRLLNQDPRYRAIYLNCEEQFDYADFFRALGHDFELGTEYRDPTEFRKIAGLLKTERPAKQIVFLFDEVDELLSFDSQSHPGMQLFKTFRALSHEGACRFIFSGGRTLFQHLRTPQSPFFNFCEKVVLGTLEDKSIAEILVKPMRQLGLELPQRKSVILRLIELSSSHPNIAQWLCDRLIKTVSDRRITCDSLEQVAATSEFCEHYVRTAWGEATPLERLISLVVEEPVFETQQVCEALRQYGVEDRMAIAQGLEMLEFYSLLHREGQQYQFVLTQFPRMVRQWGDWSVQIDSVLSQVER